MKIYVVTEGVYSDYHIITATTNKSVAQRIAAKFSDSTDDVNIEEFEDSEIFLKTLWRVVFDSHGAVAECAVGSSEFAYNDIGRVGRRWDNRLFVTVEADNADAAIKIASEKKAEFLARENGL